MNPYKAAVRAPRPTARTLADAMRGADVFVGLLGRRPGHRRDGGERWPTDPIVFALANPDPEIALRTGGRDAAAT